MIFTVMRIEIIPFLGYIERLYVRVSLLFFSFLFVCDKFERLHVRLYGTEHLFFCEIIPTSLFLCVINLKYDFS